MKSYKFEISNVYPSSCKDVGNGKPKFFERVFYCFTKFHKNSSKVKKDMTKNQQTFHTYNMNINGKTLGQNIANFFCSPCTYQY